MTTANVVRRSCSSCSTAFGALDEPRVHRLEVEEELGDVLEELTAEHAIGHLVEGLARRVEHAATASAADAVGNGEPPQQPTAEEVGHARGRLEEVDRVPRGRRVDDDEVVLAARVHLVEALHRDVVVALHEATGDVVVHPVVEDAVRGGLVGRVAQHQLVPRALGVEHRRPQLAARLHAELGVRVERHPAGHVAERLEAQRVGEALGGVDGEDEHLAAEARRGGERGRGRGRRLAHATGAAEHHHLAGGQQRGERLPLSRRGGHVQLLTERFGDHARDPQTVVAHEQIRQEQQREVDRVAQLGEVDGATAPHRHREPRRVDDRVGADTRVLRQHRGRLGRAQRLEHVVVGVGEQLRAAPGSRSPHRAAR